ncbi:TPA: hypothetical protein ACPSKZ_000689 [Legionella anisa]|uniref:hypothetical protein n=1 Tax=Legionella anisa TaxID=28082 RepID=UPI0022446D19|nr:hypothetical protein [Legionella anisa]MCW8425613.1 hypothetical protein [Legionella anisa]MCW8448958.1 hypothetical protein [Legionella anisa]
MTTSLGQTVLFNVLTPVRLVSLANVAGTYNNGPSNNGVGATLTVAASSLTIDSVAVRVGDRVLLQNQTSTFQNGIYICQSIGSTVVLKRAEDQQNIEQLKAGQFALVGAGTVNAGSAFALVEPLPQNIGVDAFIWVSSPLSAALGTAGSKAASNNALSTVASTAGSGFTVGNFTTAADTVGTIQNSGFGVNNILRYAEVAISAAEFNGMYAAPKLLIAAPGANNLIIVDRMELVMTFGAAAFAAGGVVAAQYDSTINGAGIKATNTEAAADFQAAASTVFQFNGAVNIAPFTTSVNKGLYLSNQTAAFTTGDSTFVAKIHYRIIATV